MSLLSINGLTKDFKAVRALDGLTLEVKKNEVYGFIGRNGAGKTTTINIIMGLLHADGGEVRFDGEPVDMHDINHRRRIGYVPDVPAFPRYLKAHEFLRFACEAHGIDPAQHDTRIATVLRDVGLATNERKIGSFSRGMKQRLAIAQALVHEPELLIMDEPTSALDPLGRKDVLDIITRLKDTMTVFYSTHILDDAQKVCDRIGLIEHGRVLLEASVASVMHRDDTWRYYVEAETDVDAVLKKIKALDVVKEAYIEAHGITFHIDSQQALKDVIRALVDADVALTTLTRKAKTLEDVFIEVLDENAA